MVDVCPERIPPKKFCKRSPPLELLLRFPKLEYAGLLLDYDVLPHKASKEALSEKRMRSGFQKIERYITIEAEKQNFHALLTCLRG